MTPLRNLTHANRINQTHIKDLRKNTIVPQGNKTVDFNELIDARSNQQFIDRLSTEMNKARLNRTDQKSFERPQTAKAKENEKFKQNFSSLVKNNFRSNPDVPGGGQVLSKKLARTLPHSQTSLKLSCTAVGLSLHRACKHYKP